MKVTVCFDDGLNTIYEVAFPTLEKYALQATIFPVTDGIAGRLDPTAYGRNDLQNYSVKTRHLTPEELKDLHNHGWEVGAHTKTHPELPKLSVEEIEREIVESNNYLVELALPHPYVFAYPGGLYGEREVEIVKRHYWLARAFGRSPSGEIWWNNMDSLNRHELRANNVDNFRELLNLDYSRDGWLIVVNHVLVDKLGFDEWLQTLVDKEVEMVSFTDVMTAITPAEHNYEKHYELKKGDVYVEAGAFWCRYGRIASRKVGEDGRVILIEPSPANIKVIEKVIRREKLTNVTLVRKAVWSSRTKQRFCVWGNPTAHQLSCIWGLEKGLIEVETDTIDNILDDLGIGRVDLLAADVEGAEVELAKTLDPKRILNVAIGAYHFAHFPKLVMATLKLRGYKSVVREDGMIYAR